MSDITNILSWLIFGSVIGGVAYLVEPRLRSNKPILLGILGASISGVLTNILLRIPVEEFSLTSLIVALTGASFILLWWSILKKA